MNKSEVPFFSIIVPIYNSEKYIKKCIESVINQTYASWELILVDDGSTDASGEICDSYCCDDRIKVIHQNNAGELESRINGIKIANGKYELGLDSDDYLDKKCLEILKKAVDVSGSDMILFGIRLVGRSKGIIRCSLAPGKKYSQREILEEVIENTNHSLCNKAIRMDRIKEADYSRLKIRLSINSDYELIIPIMCNIDTGYVIEDVLYNYRFRSDSASHSCKVQHIFDIGFSTEYAIHKLKAAGLMDAVLYDKINLAYFKMTNGRLVRLLIDKGISREDCKKIHKSKLYINSKKYETLKELGRYNFIILKLFRYRQYWALMLITKSPISHF